MADINQQILGQALGGQFDAASFYRAKKAGFSDRDIINAINASPSSATGQMKFIAQNYEKALSQTGPSRYRSGSYSAGGQEWGPQLMVTPNKYNPLLGGRDPYGGKFSNVMTGEDPGQNFAKRGMSFAYGPVNAQDYVNEQYWKGQVNVNPEVNYRWNTGDSLDPERDIDNQYGRLAEMDLAGLGGTEEYKKLARQRAEAYEKGGTLAVNEWGAGLHESDPRFAQIAQDPKAYAAYFTETSPTRGSSEAARWMEEALGGKVMTPLAGAPGKTTTPGTQPTQLAGKDYKNVQSAFKAAQETGQRFGTEDIRALRESTGQSTKQIVRGLREQRDEAGQTGGVLTQEARDMFRAIKEPRGERPEDKPTPEKMEKRRQAAKVAGKVAGEKAAQGASRATGM
jgi:hypothetical protein